MKAAQLQRLQSQNLWSLSPGKGDESSVGLFCLQPTQCFNTAGKVCWVGNWLLTGSPWGPVGPDGPCSNTKGRKTRRVRRTRNLRHVLLHTHIYIYRCNNIWKIFHVLYLDAGKNIHSMVFDLATEKYLIIFTRQSILINTDMWENAGVFEWMTSH